jgi:hypothetical protein
MVVKARPEALREQACLRSNRQTGKRQTWPAFFSLGEVPGYS